MLQENVQTALEMALEELAESEQYLKEQAKAAIDDSLDTGIELLQAVKQLETVRAKISVTQQCVADVFSQIKETLPSPQSPLEEEASQLPLQLTMSSKFGVATASYHSTRRVVLCAGSAISKNFYDSLDDSIARKKLLALRRGLLTESTADSYSLKIDLEFSSPSAAGGFVTGRSTNGREDWKLVATGQSLKSWQDAG